MEIRINGQIADVFNAIIAITRQGYDFTDFKKRFLGRSNRFSLPKTSKNSKIFQSPDTVNSSGRGFETSYNASVVDQGVTILKGKGLLNESSRDFKFQVIDSAKDLFDDIDGSLRQLELDSYNYIHNADGFNSIRQRGSSVWLYSTDRQRINGDVIEAGFHDDTDSPYILYLRPHFYVKVLLDKIFNSRDWTINYPDTEIENYVISVNHKQFFFTSYNLTFNNANYTGNGSYITLTDLFDWDFTHPDILVYSAEIQTYGQKTAWRLRGNVSFDGNFTIKVINTTGTGGNEKTSEEEFNITNDYINFTTSAFDSVDDSNITKFEIRGESGSSLTLIDVLLYSLIEEDDFPDWNPLDQPPDITGPFWDYQVKAYDNAPDIKQLDLFKEVFMLAGLGFETNSTTKELSVYNYSDLSRGNSIDWSSKFVTGSMSVAPQKSGLGKITELKFSNDDITLPSVGSGFISIDNDNLPATNVLTQSDFSASAFVSLAYIGGSDSVCSMEIYGQNGREQDADIRIKRVYDYLGGIYTVTTFENLDWSDMINGKYKVIIDAVQKNRGVKVNFYLSKLDVIGFRFSKTIYIEQLKSYFIVKSIGNYTPGRLTECKLLKVD